MFKNKAKNGFNNLCGQKIKILRKNQNLSQRALADLLQLKGLDVTKNSIQKIESGERFVTDIELAIISRHFNVSMEELTASICSYS